MSPGHQRPLPELDESKYRNQKKKQGELQFFTNFHRESVSLALTPKKQKEIYIQEMNFTTESDAVAAPMLKRDSEFDEREENLKERRRTIERRDTKI